MKQSFLLLYEVDRWRMGRLAGDAVETREVPGGVEAAPAVHAALADWGRRREPVCLALPSSMALSAPIPCSGLPRRQRRSAMLFRLEEQLPLDLESLTADFLPEAGGRALGVAVQTARIRELLDALSQAGIEVSAICPMALLAAWGGMTRCQGSDYILVGTARTLDLLRMREGAPVAWYTLPADGEELRRNIIADGLADPVASEQPSACLIAEPEALPPVEKGATVLKFTLREDQPPLAVATRAAAELLTGKPAGWVDLRRDALALPGFLTEGGRALRAAVALALLLPAALTAAMLWRGSQYDHIATQAYEAQSSAFRELYPDRPAPAMVKRQLQSELTRLVAVSGGSAGLPNSVSALETLRLLAGSLPPKVRVRILELRIAPKEAFIQGQTLSHGDAEQVRSALVSVGFVMEPPRTETLAEGGVAFTLTGAPPAPAAAERRAP